MAAMTQKKAGRQQSGNPAVRAGATPGNSAANKPARNLDKRSAPLILFLSQLPRWVFPAVMAILLIAGLMVPIGWVGGLLLLVLIVVLIWLTSLSWPILTVSGRLLRIITILAAGAVALARFTGRM